jgi:CMP-N-acetylneuraminic acid synthetase
MSKNIAFIPARKNSKGVTFKNRILFKNSLKFIKKLNFIDEILVSSDDEFIIDIAKKNNLSFHKRKKKYAKDDTSIKKTILNVIKEMNIEKNHTIWLFYLPIVNRDIHDFKKVLRYTKHKEFKSMCSFYEADYKYHPFFSWKIFKKKISKFIKNDIYRRQDLPKAYYHFHYISCFKVSEINKLNSELINEETKPILVNFDKRKLLEVDTHEDMILFKKKYKI